ncbi:hypothetical protein Tsubulata_018716 [Turnera subulata]|uniref:Uncharacterized protein n=1 Tax=Turnera subulata TaxID=218843 RepID=A0A9Q0GG29_9ROSI|nr:hypothetical protein Tsubulata_018716 [Turnera subulata]
MVVSGMVLQSKAKEMVMLADTLGQPLLFGSSLHIGAENDEERASKAENPNHRYKCYLQQSCNISMILHFEA